MRLMALRDAIAPIPGLTVGEAYVRELHEALDHLTAVGQDVAEFRIPATSMRRPVNSNYMSRTSTPTGDSYVDRALFMAKLGGVIGYFEFTHVRPEEERKIGFRPPS